MTKDVGAGASRSAGVPVLRALAHRHERRRRARSSDRLQGPATRSHPRHGPCFFCDTTACPARAGRRAAPAGSAPRRRPRARPRTPCTSASRGSRTRGSSSRPPPTATSAEREQRRAVDRAARAPAVDGDSSAIARAPARPFAAARRLCDARPASASSSTSSKRVVRLRGGRARLPAAAGRRLITRLRSSPSSSSTAAIRPRTPRGRALP